MWWNFKKKGVGWQQRNLFYLTTDASDAWKAESICTPPPFITLCPAKMRKKIHRRIWITSCVMKSSHWELHCAQGCREIIEKDFQLSLLFMVTSFTKSHKSTDALTQTASRNTTLVTDPAPFLVGGTLHRHVQFTWLSNIENVSDSVYGQTGGHVRIIFIATEHFPHKT